jgi:hypothetical protein
MRRFASRPGCTEIMLHQGSQVQSTALDISDKRPIATANPRQKPHEYTMCT